MLKGVYRSSVILTRQSNYKNACGRVPCRSEAASECCILDSRANRNRTDGSRSCKDVSMGEWTNLEFGTPRKHVER
jgi:hypothetical protein